MKKIDRDVLHRFIASYGVHNLDRQPNINVKLELDDESVDSMGRLAITLLD